MSTPTGDKTSLTIENLLRTKKIVQRLIFLLFAYFAYQQQLQHYTAADDRQKSR